MTDLFAFGGRVQVAALFACLCLLGPSRAAFGWDIPLDVKEEGGAAGLRYVTIGVPLLQGQAMETDQLRLAEKTGSNPPAAVPAQFRVLARWWQGDNSVRWVLADFQVDLKPGEKRDFLLTDAKLTVPAPQHKLAVEETPDQIIISTGPARFVVAKKGFNFLQAAAVDADGDGKFAADEELLASNPDCGTVLEDAFGERYYSAESTRSVEVVEKGAMRVRVRARGVHRARDGKGSSRGMYSYDYMMDFHAGSAAVYADVIVGNNFAKPIGVPCFKDGSLWMKLAGPLAGCTIAGDKEHAATPPAGGSVRLYQDSNGADTWKECEGYNTERQDYWQFPAGLTASFRGYKVWSRVAGKDEEVAAGDHARGTAHLWTGRGGLVVHMLNFWQQFPKGVEVFADGKLRMALFPREYKVPHFLEDATAKGHEIILEFYAKGRVRPEVAGADGRPDPAKAARLWEAKVMPRPAKLEHIAATGALADLGPFAVPASGLTKGPNNRTAAYDSRMLTDDGLYGNAYGWQIFGERWRSCGGHSSRGARQPMEEDDYLSRWFVTGLRGWLLAGDARSRQFRDVRSYRIEDQNPFGFKDWADFSKNNRSEDWCRRTMPSDDEAKKYGAGRYPRTTFWLPNPEHMVLDLCYDRYLLTGDQRSFENLPIIAAHGGYFVAYSRHEVHRATGWCLRTVYRYWDLTGDKDAEKLLKVAIQTYKKMAEGPIALPMGKNKEGKDTVSWWFSFVFARGAAMSALGTGDPDALFICKRLAETFADARGKYEGYFPADFAELHAVLWRLTGDEKYKALGLGADKGENLKRVSGGMKQTACALWLLEQPPKK